MLATDEFPDGLVGPARIHIDALEFVREVDDLEWPSPMPHVAIDSGE